MNFVAPQLDSADLVLVEASLAKTQGLLRDAALTEDFSDLLMQAFGPLFRQEAGVMLQQELATGSYDWPAVEVHSAAELQGALGAYAAARRTVYVSESFVLANAQQPEAIVAVLLEELGDDFDEQLNLGRDTAGDEGAVFSALLRGQVLEQSQREALRVENDGAVLRLDGEAVVVERATFTVTNSDDSGIGSLRQAILDANASAGADVIDFALAPNDQTISLTSSELLITDDLTIDGDVNDDGAPDITVARAVGAAEFRIFNLDSGNSTADKTIQIDGLTITGGRIGVGSGGGIASSENLRLSNSTVSGNSTTDGNGGGIFSRGGDLSVGNSTVSSNSTAGVASEGGGISNIIGNLSISNSTVSGNSTAGNISFGGGISSRGGDFSVSNSTVSGNFTTGNSSYGGGIYSASGDLSVSNSTISGNFTTGDNSEGGGIFSSYGLLGSSGGDLSVSNSTISGNSTAGTNSPGGGIYSQKAPTINNSIVSGNIAQQSDANEIQVVLGQGTGSNNVLGDDSQVSGAAFSNFDTSNSITATRNGTNPTALDDILEPLTDNGGDTEIHALPVGSPALNAGANPESLATDQRGPGFARSVGQTDIGAFEVQDVAPSITSPANAAVSENQTSAVDVDATDDSPGITFSLTGGADQGLFNIDMTTGVVTFKLAPDFENPSDVGSDNVYDIQVTAIDVEGLTDTQEIAITVTDLGEDASIRLEKFTNGQASPTAAQATKIAAGEVITWTYRLTNDGDTALNAFKLADDNGTIADTSDDFTLELSSDGSFDSNDISLASGDSNSNFVFDPGETWILEATSVAQDLSVSVNFDETLINGAGDIITKQYNSAQFGFLEVSTPVNPFGAMIFDSANPTGGDWDLGTPTQPTGPGVGTDSGAGMGNVIAQNNVLIISEDGNPLNPDDNAMGGILRFSFGEEHGVALDAVDLLDIDATERMVTAESFLNNQSITSREALPLGDNSFQELQLQGDIANRLEVNFIHSGAVTTLDYRRIYGNAATFTAMAGGEILRSSDVSFYTNPSAAI